MKHTCNCGRESILTAEGRTPFSAPSCCFGWRNSEWESVWDRHDARYLDGSATGLSRLNCASQPDGAPNARVEFYKTMRSMGVFTAADVSRVADGPVEHQEGALTFGSELGQNIDVHGNEEIRAFGAREGDYECVSLSGCLQVRGLKFEPRGPVWGAEKLEDQRSAFHSVERDIAPVRKPQLGRDAVCAEHDVDLRQGVPPVFRVRAARDDAGSTGLTKLATDKAVFVEHFDVKLVAAEQLRNWRASEAVPGGRVVSRDIKPSPTGDGGTFLVETMSTGVVRMRFDERPPRDFHAQDAIAAMQRAERGKPGGWP